MRLTLRTLLAYLDDVLDPADKEELAKKIESSEFAEDLVHRTRDTMRRLRLSAPQVVGAGMGLDPNSVAEYLDNALTPEQVGEFERICLESDVHLAETAACHHVLTMVLGEPAEVEPRARQRMYGIADEARERKHIRVEPAHNLGMTSAVVASAAPMATPTMPTPAPQPTTRTTEVPEYLRAGSIWPKLGIAALAAVLLIGLGLTFASGIRGWFGGNTSLAELTPSEQKDIQPPPATSIGPSPSTAPAPSVDPAPDDATASADASTVAPLSSPPQPLTPGVDNSVAISAVPMVDPYAAPAATDVTADTVTVEPTSPDTPQATQPAEPGENETAVLSPPAPGDGTANVVPPLPAEAVPPPDTTAAVTPLPVTPPPPTPDTTDTTGEMPADAGIAPADSTVAPAEAAVPAGPAELGTYMSTDSVLLRHDDNEGVWFRMEPRQAVTAGQRLLTLPEFRSTITLAGVIVDMTGGSQVVLSTANEMAADGLAAGAASVPAIDVVYGRVVLSNRSSGEQPLRLKLGTNVSDTTLARNSTLAIEVERVFVPGNDPRTAESPVVVKLYAPEGGVEWQDASGSRSLAAGAQWVIAGGATTEAPAGTALPDWIGPVASMSPREQLQRKAAAHVSSTLLSNRPAEIQLMELYQSNVRREVKDLVARASMYVGLFEPFVNALRDPSQKWPAWESNVKSLRTAIALSPDAAEKVAGALAAEHDETAAKDLYKMLCGYSPDEIGRSPEQWKAGAMVQLIDWLEDENLDYRVLAVYNLAEITEKRLTDPAATPNDRRISVKNWRKRLDSGELRPVQEGEGLPQ